LSLIRTAPQEYDAHLTVVHFRWGKSQINMEEATIVDRIRRSILEQTLVPGTKLVESSLCEIFGEGRTTIRRALLTLSRENLVQIEKNKGAIVSKPSISEARQVFEARGLVELSLIEQVINNATARDIKRLKSHLVKEQKAFDKGDTPTWIRLTGEFHIELSKSAINEPLKQFLEKVVIQSSLIISLYGTNPAGTGSCCSTDHTDIVNAIESRDTEKAARLLRKHLAEVEGTLNLKPMKKAKGLADLVRA